MSRYFIRKTTILLIAIWLMALGVALYFRGNMGADPVSTLCDGLFKSFAIPRGTASVAVNGGLFLVFLLFDRTDVNLGSFFAAFGVGPFIGMWEHLLDLLVPSGWKIGVLQILLPLAGTVFIALGRALYLPCRCGAAPFDMTILAICRKTGWSYRKSYILLSSAIFVAGLCLHGAWGVGTVIAILLPGHLVDFWTKRWGRSLARFAGVEANSGTAGK